MRWAEEIASGTRRRLGAGNLTPELVETHLPHIQVTEEYGPSACHHRPGGRVELVVPPGDARALAHELGEACCNVGLGWRLAATGAPTARRQLIRDYAVAERFATALGEASNPLEDRGEI